MKLIPEQVEQIKIRIELLEGQSQKTRENIKETKETGHVGLGSYNSGFEHIPDFSSLHELGNIKKELEELRLILNDSVIINKYDSEKINIGTKFTVTLDLGNGKIKTANYILVEKDFASLSLSKTYISLDSPLGQAVYNKKNNDVICYYTPKQQLIGGLIEEIAPSREEMQKQKTI